MGQGPIFRHLASLALSHGSKTGTWPDAMLTFPFGTLCFSPSSAWVFAHGGEVSAIIKSCFPSVSRTSFPFSIHSEDECFGRRDECLSSGISPWGPPGSSAHALAPRLPFLPHPHAFGQGENMIR